MKRFLLSSLVMMLFAGHVFSAFSFSEVDLRLFDDSRIVFPTDIVQGEPVVVALTLSSSRSNGEQQQEAFLEWHENIVDQVGEQRLYHIAVIDGAPFFVRGAIRSGLAKSYEGIVKPSQGGVIFLSRAERFAAQGGISIDGEPTLVVLSPDQNIAGVIKGSYSEQKKNQLLALL
ncbi:MAG: hypothetical protein EOM15_02410 [Spirochaetia bacterium]|nr:hypothetical protein [Spirochaetia bacterium]